MKTALELMNQKLQTVPKPHLQDLAKRTGMSSSGPASEIIQRLLTQDHVFVDAFIKECYAEKISLRQHAVISDDELLTELRKVQSIDWVIEQGRLDAHIQSSYVRQFARYDDLVREIEVHLHSAVTDYAVASWYNHWSTVLIEDHISQHANVVPTIKNRKGIDLFIDDEPFDLKVTYLPKEYDVESALSEPLVLGRWLYEHQGEQRFGSDNRFYVVLLNLTDLRQSWKMKREMGILIPRINKFLDTVTVSKDDVLPFVYKNTSYTPKCKMLLITGSV